MFLLVRINCLHKFIFLDLVCTLKYIFIYLSILGVYDVKSLRNSQVFTSKLRRNPIIHPQMRRIGSEWIAGFFRIVGNDFNIVNENIKNY